MKIEELRRVVSQPESESLELKVGIPRPLEIAKILVGMENSRGGVVLFGVREGGSVVGISRERLQRAFEAAKSKIEPYTTAELSFFELDEKTVGVIELAVDQVVTRILSTVEGISYQRSGDKEVPISATTILEHIKTASPSVKGEPEAHLADLALNIERLNAQLVEQGKLKNKLPELLVGALIGAIFSVLVSVLVG